MSVTDIDGWEVLVGPFRAYAEFEGGAPDRTTLVRFAQERAAAEGWTVAAPIEHPGAIELPITRGELTGTITSFGPPSIDELGGRIRLLYTDEMDWREPVSAAIGGILGGLLGWLALAQRADALPLKRREAEAPL